MSVQSSTPIADRLAKLSASKAPQPVSETTWTVRVPAIPGFSVGATTHDVATRTAQGLSRSYGQAEVSDGTKVVAQYVRGALVIWRD